MATIELRHKIRDEKRPLWHSDAPDRSQASIMREKKGHCAVSGMMMVFIAYKLLLLKLFVLAIVPSPGLGIS